MAALLDTCKLQIIFHAGLLGIRHFLFFLQETQRSLSLMFCCNGGNLLLQSCRNSLGRRGDTTRLPRCLIATLQLQSRPSIARGSAPAIVFDWRRPAQKHSCLAQLLLEGFRPSLLKFFKLVLEKKPLGQNLLRAPQSRV